MTCKNDNRKNVVTAIWENPARLFGGEWKRSGSAWEYIRGGEWKQRGAVRLLLKNGGTGITVCFNSGSGRAGETLDVFDYVRDMAGLPGFYEALQRVAEMYGVALSQSEAQREQLNRVSLAREVFPALLEALERNPDGEAARYLRESRRFSAFGRYFGELTGKSIANAKQALKARGIEYSEADFSALGLTERNAADGYSVVIPYYHCGQIRGFLLRNTRPECSGGKYRFSTGLQRAGYCQQLKSKTAYIVEGEFDAIRLLQAAETTGRIAGDVIAMGRAKPGEDLAGLLRSRGVDTVVYIPDREHDEQGARKVRIINEAIRAFQQPDKDGRPVASTLWMIDLPANGSLNGLKIDADSFGAEQGAEALAHILATEARPAWVWELEQLEQLARSNTESPAFVAELQNRVKDIYTRNRIPFERARIRQYIGRRAATFSPYGITPEALADLAAFDRRTGFRAAIGQAAAELAKAAEEQAAPEVVADIVRRLQTAQAYDKRIGWEAQLSESFGDELEAIRQQPDVLRTGWEVGEIDKAGNYRRTEFVEFYPADITVFCAPTSHGKTMALFQSAINAVRGTQDTFFYVSCEENKRQLTERAINVSMNIQTTPTGKDENGGPCFITGTRKHTIKAILRGKQPPEEYNTDTIPGAEHYDALAERVRGEIDRYATEIRPRLKFIHTEESAESIAGNILYYVEQYRRKGVKVGGVFVDYMQLLTTEARTYSRHDELKSICKVLKDCAARTELPVIIAAQLNRDTLKQGIDSITVANIGEGADIERIAHDIFLLWQVDKTPVGNYTKTANNGKPYFEPQRLGYRSGRLFAQPLGRPDLCELKTGYLYVEQMKARDGETNGWGLFPFDGERGTIGKIAVDKMKQ